MRTVTIFLLSIIILFSGCKSFNNPGKVHFQGLAQGTYYAVTYFDQQERNLQHEVDSILKAFDQSASVYVDSSTISKINSDDLQALTDPIVRELLHRSAEISKATGGAFDITVGPLVNAWGFGFTDRMEVNDAVIDSLLQLVNYKAVKLKDGKIVKEDPRISIDFNAIAQGYSVDLLGKYLESKGINRYLVDIGGEVLAKGKKPSGEHWKVGIEKPAESKEDERTLKAIVNLKDRAMATSGNYRKYYEKGGVRYSHTINPKTGYPVQHSLLSASVVADDCATADGFATAFMVMGLDEAKSFLQERQDMAGYFIYSDQNGNLKTYATEGLKEILKKEYE
ncbi:MAG: FAD:protein FMN transferase [Bacteroidales bacterium]|nr:FAD:protein FMN transferase [Bacteroidales bacterium]